MRRQHERAFATLRDLQRERKTRPSPEPSPQPAPLDGRGEPPDLLMRLAAVVARVPAPAQ
jgi:hypothetical protein